MIPRHCLISYSSFFPPKYLTWPLQFPILHILQPVQELSMFNRKVQIHSSLAIHTTTGSKVLCICTAGRKQSTGFPGLYHEIFSYLTMYSYTCNLGWPTNVPFVSATQTSHLRQGNTSAVQFDSSKSCKSFLKLDVISITVHYALASCQSTASATTAIPSQLTCWNQTGLQCTSFAWRQECSLAPLMLMSAPLTVCSVMETRRGCSHSFM